MPFAKKKRHFPKKMSLCAQDETRTHTILRPLPPQSSVYTNFTTCAECPEQDSNLHTSRHAHLKRTRLPIPPSGQKKESGKRDSNSRPRPWQGRALPTELFPQSYSFYYLKERNFSKAGAKVLLFFDIRKFFCIFFAFLCKKVSIYTFFDLFLHPLEHIWSISSCR